MNPKEKEGELNKLLNFIHEDLDALPHEDKMLLAMEISFTYGFAFVLDEDARSDQAGKKKFKNLLKVQLALKNHVKEIMEADPDTRLSIPPLKREFIVGNSFLIKYSTSEDRIIDDSKSVNASLVIAGFDELLDGFPRSILHVCPECGRIYAYIAKKRRDYCSPKCAYKFLSRKRREGLKKHPRKYKTFLKRQRESMRRVYEKRQQERLGPNVRVRRNAKGK